MPVEWCYLMETDVTQHWVKNPNCHISLLCFTEKVNHLKINRARSRKTLRKTYLKVNRKTRAMCPRKTPAQDHHKKKSAIWEATNKKSAIREWTKKNRRHGKGRKYCWRFFWSMAKMKVQVMTINSVQKSSKSELSSCTFDYFKVQARPLRKTSTQDLHARPPRKIAQDILRKTKAG